MDKKRPAVILAAFSEAKCEKFQFSVQTDQCALWVEVIIKRPAENLKKVGTSMQDLIWSDRRVSVKHQAEYKMSNLSTTGAD